jgi:dTDP-4-dehydrorhamnose 3,5-epimerase
VDIRELAVPGAYEITPKQLGDPRGLFLEWYRADRMADALGYPLDLAQVNCSVSARGVLRGIHFAEVPPGQAKYVTCVAGAGLDVVVDLRVGSATFGQYDAVLIDTVDRRAVYVGEGLGHAFLALEDGTTINYLLSEPYAPGREHGVNPLDPALAIAWPLGIEPVLSDKDRAAPSLAEAEAAGLLPSYDACQAYAAELAARARVPA